MAPVPSRRRPARPVPEAPLDALVARAEDLAKAWLIATIEQEPLDRAREILAEEWASSAPEACAAVLLALGSDDQLDRVRAARFAGRSAVDPLRAVIWSALRSAWPDCHPDQVWDLGERLAFVIELVRADGAPAAPPGSWPDALEQAIGQATATGTALSLLLVELGEAERVATVEPPDRATDVLRTFAEAARSSLEPGLLAFDDGDARVWVIAPGRVRPDALAISSVLTDAVRAATDWRGAPLDARIGVAVLGEDGADAAALIAAAEEAMFEAAASGIEVTRGRPGAGEPDG